jgi:hypothetical protein
MEKMKKQRIAFLLSFAWLIGIVAVFSFPPEAKYPADSQSSQSELRGISAPELAFTLVDYSPEIPPLKAGASFPHFLNPDWTFDLVSLTSQYFAPSFFTKSRALFDVLITFFYFFHTW